jgi:uncharacterized Zn-finger protein
MPFEFVTNAGRRISLLNEDDVTSVSNDYLNSKHSSSEKELRNLGQAPFGKRKFGLTDPENYSYQPISEPYRPPSPPFKKLQPVGYPHNYFYHPQYPANLIAQTPTLSVAAPTAPVPRSTESSPPDSGISTSAATPSPVDSTPKLPQSPVEDTKTAIKPTKRYTCHCQRSFTTSGHLARHMRIHTGEKNYVCPQAGCEARFSRQDNCLQHYRTHLGTSRKSNSNNKKGGPTGEGGSSSTSKSSLSDSKTSRNSRSSSTFGGVSRRGTRTRSSRKNRSTSTTDKLSVFAGLAIEGAH